MPLPAPRLEAPAIPEGQGRVLNIQRFSLQDGPGVRTTVFLKGCPLECAWCHNPESQSPDFTHLKVEARCVACGSCESGPSEADRVELCPTGARQRLGRDLGVEDLVEEVLRDRIFFDESGGGVTLSGGEPLFQAPFAVAFLRALRDRGVDTALDTCGFCGQERLLEAAAQADTVLFDLKHLDDAQHRAWTGVGNGPILANLEALAQVHGRIWIRVPVIPGVNDDWENLEATARFVARFSAVERLDLLPYHNTGAAKFRRLGRVYLLDQVRPPEASRLSESVERLQAHGLTVRVGGHA